MYSVSSFTCVSSIGKHVTGIWRQLARFKSLEDIPMKNRKVFVTVQGLTTDQEGI